MVAVLGDTFGGYTQVPLLAIICTVRPQSNTSNQDHLGY